MAKTKTELATAALIHAHPVLNRGHAYMLLREVELHRVHKRAVSAYEARFGVTLGESKAHERRARDAEMRANAHRMSADEVREHIDSIDDADPLFWGCWRAFRDEGKWSTLLTVADFAVHFRPRKARAA